MLGGGVWRVLVGGLVAGRGRGRVRFVRWLGLVCGLVVCLMVGGGSAYGYVWARDGGTRYLKADTSEVIKSWTAREWRVWGKEVRSVGECMGVEEHCAASELAGETPLEDPSGLLAEDSQEGVKEARVAGRSLDGEVQNDLDLDGEDAGTLPYDLGVNAVTNATLGGVPHILGVELGNGLDQWIELPEWHPVSSGEEEEMVKVHEWLLAEPLRVHVKNRALNPSGTEEAPEYYTLPAGTYLASYAGTAGGPSFGVIEEGITCTKVLTLEGCESFNRTREGEYVPPGFTRKEFIDAEGWYYPGGILTQDGIAIYEYKPPEKCPAVEATSPGMVGAKGAPGAWTCPPVGVPAPGLITPEIEEDNTAAGLPARPKEPSPVSLPTVPPSSLTESELEEISENSLGREQIEEMFPDKKREEEEGGVEVEEGELLGGGNEGEPDRKYCLLGRPVNCATGNEEQAQTDLSVGGRGPKLGLALTYNSLLAVKQATAGPFGYGWTGSYSAHLELGEEGKEATVYQDNGSTVMFTRVGEAWSPSSGLVQSTLADEGSGYVYTLPDRTRLHFGSSGELASEEDRNGNAITLGYNGEKQLETVTDGAGRKLTFKYNGSGEVESVKDPMGHTVKYTYESGNLTSVILPGEEKARWQYKYDSDHELTSETDGRGHTWTTEYNEDHQVVSQMDAMSHKRSWVYATKETGSETTITEPNGSSTVERFNENGSPTSVTHAAGTSIAASTTYEYNSNDELVSAVDPNKEKTEYGYDANGNKTSEKDPSGEEKKWKYDGKHDIETETTPEGETATIKRNTDGDPETIERSIGGETQKTTYKYDSYGDVESMTDPLEHTWKYTYDSYGDRVSETDPEGDKRTWEYNSDSQQTSTVSPRGNVTGGEPSKYTTSIERDPQGRVLAVIHPEAIGVSAPVNKTSAVISGAAQEGATLTAGTGVWEGVPSLSYSYQWQACNVAGGECFNVPGLVEPMLSLDSEAVGYTLRVVVTASNSIGSASSTSAATAVVSVSAPPVFASAFGSSGSGNGQFTHPVGVAVDPHGDIWVTDAYDSRIEKFSSTGSWLATYGKLGLGNGEYFEPVGIAINQSTDNVYVVDQYTGKVQELNEKGEWLRSWEGHEGAFAEPSGIAIDAKGNVWVTDYGNDRVEEFNEKGEFLLKFGSAGGEGGKFLGPGGVVIANGYAYVTDFNSARLEAFTEEGRYLGEGGYWGIGIEDFVYPYGLTADTSGNVYVDELGNDRIQELTRYGNFITMFGSGGSSPGQFSEPHDLAFNSAGELYVTDSEDNRVEKWVAAGSPVNTTAPSISGELRTGKTVSANTGVWSAVPTATDTYQWQRCNGSGAECSDIAGATGATYALVKADLGSTMRVVVTATNSHGSAASTSAATGLVVKLNVTEYTYDADGNIESETDGDGHITKYAYNDENLPIKTEEPNGDHPETEYDSEGEMIGHTDGNAHKWEYKRNALEEITEEINPLGKITKKKYDKAGNLETLEDPEKHTTTYKYDENNRLTEISYSTGKPSTVKYVYNKDGDITSMTDESGETKNTYDKLDRLTESKDGAGKTVKYEYDLNNQPIKITYPNGKVVTREYDKDGRLEKVTDWNSKTTKFAYNADSDLTTTVFPSSTEDEDTYAYNEADQMTAIKMLEGTSTLASLLYTRGNDSEIKNTTTTGLPGPATNEDTYDENNRLTESASSLNKYDKANNPTEIEGANGYTYNEADELKEGPETKYAYDEDGQRTKMAPTTGPATTYGYDEAGNLTTVERPKEGEIPKIEDTYTYNGEGLRTSQAISGTTTNLTWNTTETTPNLLSDETNSYIYGPDNMPIEQINNTTGAVLYLHHDQQGSTRLLTGSTGKTEATFTYDAYGNQTGHTGTATTPLGFDGQYTSSDTGLIYLRARTYDPATAQFLSVDPLEMVTRAPFTYGEDNPLNRDDATGLSSWNPFSESFWTEGNFISESPLNPIPYYEAEIESYENGCGYFASVAHGLEGAVAGTALFAGGEGADEADITVSDVLEGKLGSITRAPLPPGSPAWADIQGMSIADIRAAAKGNEPGFKTILKLLTDNRFNKP